MFLVIASMIPIFRVSVSAQPLKVNSAVCFGETWGTLGLSVQKTFNGHLLGYTAGTGATGYGIINSRIDNSANITWEKHHGADMGYNSFIAMKPWFNGKFVVAGRYQNQDYTYSTQIFLMDTLGNTAWSAINTVPGMLETPNDIAVMSDSGFLCIGDHEIAPPATGDRRTTLLRISKTGQKLWQKEIGDDSWPAIGSVIALPDNEAMICGFTSHKSGQISCTTHGGNDAFLAKTDSAGNVLWQQCYGGGSDDYFSRIILANDGGVIAAGFSYSNDGEVTGNHGASDFWIVKLDMAGQIQWSKLYGGSDEEMMFCLEKSIYGGYLAGGFTKSFDGQVTGNHSDPGHQDAWLIRIGENGDLIWQQCFGGKSDETIYGLAEETGAEYTIFSQSSSNGIGNLTCQNDKIQNWLVFATDTTKSGFSEAILADQPAVYPNPASTYITFEKKDIQQGMDMIISLRNVLGCEVLRTRLAADQKKISIPVPENNSGLLFYRIDSVRKIYSGKILIAPQTR